MAKIMRIIILMVWIILGPQVFGQFWIQKSSLGAVGRHRATGCATSHRGYIGLGHVNGTGKDISYNA